MAPKPFWDEAKLAIIREHAPTMSASQIAAVYFPTMTRSAIIGIAHRSGIQLRKAIGPPRVRTRKRVTIVKAIAAPSLAPRQDHMRGSSAPMLVRPQVQRRLPPSDPEPENNVRPNRRMAFEGTGGWTLWNIGSDQCRFPIGHDGTLTLFCGHIISQTVPPYCHHHHTIATGGWGATPRPQRPTA